MYPNLPQLPKEVWALLSLASDSGDVCGPGQILWKVYSEKLYFIFLNQYFILYFYLIFFFYVASLIRPNWQNIFHFLCKCKMLVWMFASLGEQVEQANHTSFRFYYHHNSEDILPVRAFCSSFHSLWYFIIFCFGPSF